MAADNSEQFALLNNLAEEFLERYRRGERPSLKEYVDRHPHLESEIREVFPAMAMLEKIAIHDASMAGDETGPATVSVAHSFPELGDYRIIREVGRGGMGVVYEAEQVSLGRHVALKVLPGHGLLNPTFLERFRREAKSAARLHHTNIVPVFGTGDENGTHYYAMQFIRGEGLDRVVNDLRQLRRPGQSPPARTRGGVDAERGVQSGIRIAHRPGIGGRFIVRSHLVFRLVFGQSHRLRVLPQRGPHRHSGRRRTRLRQ